MADGQSQYCIYLLKPAIFIISTELNYCCFSRARPESVKKSMKAFWEYFTLDSLIFTAMTCFLWRMISTSSSHSSTNLASCMAVLTWREKQQHANMRSFYSRAHTHICTNTNQITYVTFYFVCVNTKTVYASFSTSLFVGSFVRIPDWQP